MTPVVDRARLAAPLAVDQGESSWLCAELTASSGERRRVALLVWLHRTGPRLDRFEGGLGLMSRDLLPARVRDLVPEWMPLVTPFRIQSDDRPLLLVAFYDLDRPDDPPFVLEEPIEHEDFDGTTFSGSTSYLALRVEPTRIAIEVRTIDLKLAIEGHEAKAAVQFGDASPILRHGGIEIGYVQRPRIELRGECTFRGERMLELVGEGAHDRHWRSSSPRNLAWLWLHLRLPSNREVNCYVLKSSRAPYEELGRGAWLIDPSSNVARLGEFGLTKESEGYLFNAPSIPLRLRFDHAVKKPYIPLRAFGDALAGGIAEAPIRTRDDTGMGIEGWLEVFDSAIVRAR